MPLHTYEVVIPPVCVVTGRSKPLPTSNGGASGASTGESGMGVVVGPGGVEPGPGIDRSGAEVRAKRVGWLAVGSVGGCQW